MSTNAANKRPLSADHVSRLEKTLHSALQKNQRPFSADDVDRLEKALVHAVQNPTFPHLPLHGTFTSPTPSSSRHPAPDTDPLGPCTLDNPTILPGNHLEELKQEVHQRYDDVMNSDSPNPQFLFIIYQMMQKYVGEHGLTVYVSKEHAENGHYWLQLKLAGVIIDLLMFSADCGELQNWAPEALSEGFQITKHWRSLNEKIACEDDSEDSEAIVDAYDNETDVEEGGFANLQYDDETDVEEGGFANLR